jgi:hypothetical protein
MEHAGLLGDPDRLRPRDEPTRYRVERDYRIITAPEPRCGMSMPSSPRPATTSAERLQKGDLFDEESGGRAVVTPLP